MTEDPRMDVRLARRIANKKKKLDAYRPLSPDIVQRLHGDFRVLFTYNSNAIEGNTLTLAETQMVLEYGMTVEGHPLREYLETTNHAEAFDFLDTLISTQISLETVLKIHALVMDKIMKEAGQLRTVQVYIRGSHHTPPPARDVSLYMMQWVRWLNSDDALRYDPITRVAIAHRGFEALHPFTDGNGRVGRLLMNLQLIQEGYPPALILREWRTRYITALQAAYQGNFTDLVNLVGLAVEHSLDLYLEACEASTARLIPLKELAELYGLDNNYLGQLARLGKMEATKRGAFWYASREALQHYLREVQEQPRGRRSTREKSEL
ncbi:MAG: Fic family protein [Ktedonobacteraceae bacterium]